MITIKKLTAALTGICLAAGIAHADGGFTNTLDNSMQERAALTRFHGHAPVSRTGKMTLGAALQTVIDGTGLQFQVDWNALREMGLTEDSEVTVPEKVLTYDQYLRAVGAELGIDLVASYGGDAGGFSLTTVASHPVPTPALAQQEATRPQIRVPSDALTPVAHASLDTPQDAAVRRKLSSTPTNVQFNAIPFEKAIATLKDAAGCNLDVNWTALQAAGIDKNTPVSCQMTNVAVRKALSVLLHQVGGGSAQLGYTIADGVIEISTSDELNSSKYQSVHVYDIRGLLTGRALDSRSYDDCVKDIIDTLKTSVAPESWRDAGGQVGSIRELNGFLIVNQTFDNHAAIVDLLRQLGSRRGVRAETLVVK